MLHIQLLFILLEIADNGLDPSVAAIIKIILDFARREFFHQVINIRYRLADGIETDIISGKIRDEPPDHEGRSRGRVIMVPPWLCPE